MQEINLYVVTAIRTRVPLPFSACATTIEGLQGRNVDNEQIWLRTLPRNTSQNTISTQTN